MKKSILSSVIASSILLAACGGGGGGDSDGPGANVQADVNVAALINGATAVSDYNSMYADNLIDGDPGTSWISDPGVAIRINFSEVKNISSFTLSYTSAAVSFGTNPDILVELSTDGNNFSASSISYVTSGIACVNSTRGGQAMSCDLSAPHATRAVRITSQNGKSFQFTEFEAIARK